MEYVVLVQDTFRYEKPARIYCIEAESPTAASAEAKWTYTGMDEVKIRGAHVGIHTVVLDRQTPMANAIYQTSLDGVAAS